MKAFETVARQIEILKDRGMIVGADAEIVLLRENYYAVINGYKDPFLDRTAMQSRSEDAYLRGTEFEWIYNLFLFDRELRRITFGYLMQAEAALKTAAVYAFCKAHPECADYTSRASFASARDMLVAKSFRGNKVALHAKNLNRLMDTLNGKLVIGPSTGPFTAHYLNTYGEVPLWVLANDLTFGNMAHFYQLMRRSEQNDVCKILAITTMRSGARSRITPHNVLRTYELLVYYRNLCAHDERLYCAQKDGAIYADMLRQMEFALPEDVIEHMRSDLEDLLTRHRGKLRVVQENEMRKLLGLN